MVEIEDLGATTQLAGGDYLGDMSYLPEVVRKHLDPTYKENISTSANFGGGGAAGSEPTRENNNENNCPCENLKI